jgi:hypothetical protein
MQAIRVDKAIALQRLGGPFGARDGVDMKHVHGVDLFKGTALGLDHEEVDDDGEDGARDSEDQAVVVVDLIGDHGAEERDQEVEKPVRGRSESHASSAVAGGVQFTDDGPDKRSPGRSESGNEQACEDNHDVSCLRGARRVVVVQLEVSDEGVDEEAHEHPEGAENHGLSPAYVLNNPQANNRGGNVYGSQDDGGDV